MQVYTPSHVSPCMPSTGPSTPLASPPHNHALPRHNPFHPGNTRGEREERGADLGAREVDNVAIVLEEIHLCDSRALRGWSMCVDAVSGGCVVFIWQWLRQRVSARYRQSPR
jgi:hypothetical protein